jgi:hypothetical protein
MKYLILIFVLFTILIFPVFSQNDFVLNWNLGNIGVGANFPISDIISYEGMYSLLHIGLEHKMSNIGIDFSPFTVFYWSPYEEINIDDSNANIYLFNIKAFWNVFSTDNGFYIGPFVSVNYMNVDKKFYWDSAVFTVGAHIGFKFPFQRVNYNVVSGEMGYRNINGTSKYYVSAKIDILALAIFYFAANAVSDPHYHY